MIMDEGPERNATYENAKHMMADPNSTAMKIGVTTVILIICMAEMPLAVDTLPRAAMINVENARNTPATMPVPNIAKTFKM
jgi:saccharopine dehydrogenase-like NADP-dependent oxidoreductase